MSGLGKLQKLRCLYCRPQVYCTLRIQYFRPPESSEYVSWAAQSSCHSNRLWRSTSSGADSLWWDSYVGLQLRWCSRTRIRKCFAKDERGWFFQIKPRERPNSSIIRSGQKAGERALLHSFGGGGNHTAAVMIDLNNIGDVSAFILIVIQSSWQTS